MIYLDNSATAFPKPPEVLKAMEDYFVNIGCNPGRGGHSLARKGELIINETRELLAQFFNADAPSKFIFTLNATYALNLIIKGALRPGDHAIITNFEHNSVIRPMYKLQKENRITFSIFESDQAGNFSMDKLEELIRPETKLICVNHGSNVLGQLSPLEEITRLTAQKGIKLLVDGSQTSGKLPVDIAGHNMDFFVFTSHKGLLGPSGVGGAYIKDPFSLNTLVEGGTGQNSHSPEQPNNLPGKFEAGTLNYLGIAGLNASMKIIKNKRREYFDHELYLTRYLYDNLKNIEEIQLYGTDDFMKKLPIIAFNIKGLFSKEVAYELDHEFNIITRPGLHCAPLIHKTTGTYPNGSVRISLGYKTTKEEIDYLAESIKKIISRHN